MKLTFTAAQTPEAQKAKSELETIFGNTKPDNADVIVALGGDGHMLATLHQFMNHELPIYGMHYGSVGFLLNASCSPEDLEQKISDSESNIVHPLSATITLLDEQEVHMTAFNEVALFRQTSQAAKLSIKVDKRMRLKELISDGILLSTAVGSTAYNLSVHGPIIPLGAELLALTPISPFRPRRWRGALLPAKSVVEIENLEPKKRAVTASADNREQHRVKRIKIKEDKDIRGLILLDPDHALQERLIHEQFQF